MTATKTPAKKVAKPAPAPTKQEKAPAKQEKGEALTTRQVAEELGTDARTLRKFLRDTPAITNAGKGHRYALDRKQLPALRKGFDAWRAKDAERRTKKSSTLSDDELRTMLADRTVAQLREDLHAHGIDYDRSRPTKAKLIDALIRERDIWA